MNYYNKKQIGFIGECIATQFLIKNGFEIVERNYSIKNNLQGGEIDIIAIKNNTIHFIEVKFRNSNLFGLGRESVTPRKQNSIRKIAKYYLVCNKLWEKTFCQFDVIEVNGQGANQTVEYFENCF